MNRSHRILHKSHSVIFQAVQQKSQISSVQHHKSPRLFKHYRTRTVQLLIQQIMYKFFTEVQQNTNTIYGLLVADILSPLSSKRVELGVTDSSEVPGHQWSLVSVTLSGREFIREPVTLPTCIRPCQCVCVTFNCCCAIRIYFLQVNQKAGN